MSVVSPRVSGTRVAPASVSEPSYQTRVLDPLVPS